VKTLHTSIKGLLTHLTPLIGYTAASLTSAFVRLSVCFVLHLSVCLPVCAGSRFGEIKLEPNKLYDAY